MKLAIYTLTLLLGMQLYAQQPKSSLKQGDIIPSFEKIGLDGKKVSIDGIDSKLIIIDFWASWCGPCIKSYKSTLKPLYNRYDRSQVEVIGISNDRKKSSWEAAAKKHKMPWPNIWDDDQSLVRAFDVPALPTYFIVNNNGEILASNVFSSELNAQVTRLLKKN